MRGTCVCPEASMRYCTQAKACVDVKTDAQHCGTCGKSCQPNEYCTGGQCVCRACRWFSHGNTEKFISMHTVTSKDLDVWTALIFEGALSWGTISLVSKVGVRLLLTKHSPEGRLLWSRVFECVGFQCQINRVKIQLDNQGNGYLGLAFFNGQLDLRTPNTKARKTKVRFSNAG
ncbi:MAG: hypothetical protein AAGJ35_07625, partial [Myxococcota bacterium]